MTQAIADRRKLASAVDNILDAFVALGSARRVVQGQAQVLPAEPEQDAMGLRMEIVG